MLWPWLKSSSQLLAPSVCVSRPEPLSMSHIIGIAGGTAPSGVTSATPGQAWCIAPDGGAVVVGAWVVVGASVVGGTVVGGVVVVGAAWTSVTVQLRWTPVETA